MDSVSLYPIVFCGEQAGNQSSLYHRGRGRNFEKGETCGFTTYFNSFSLKKWKKYTTRETFTLAIGGRIVKRLLMGKMNGLRYLALALKDFNGGFYRLTETGADEKNGRSEKGTGREKPSFRPFPSDFPDPAVVGRLWENS